MVRVHRYLNPKWLIFGPLALLLIVAVACGDDEVPAPAPGIDTAAISSAVESSVAAAVAKIPAAEAPEIDVAAIQSAVEAAVAAAVPEGTSAEEIESLVSTAVAAGVTPGATKEEIAALVADAVAEATAAQPKALTAADVKAIVETALAPEGTMMEGKELGFADAVNMTFKFTGKKPRYGGTFLNGNSLPLSHIDHHQGAGGNIMNMSQLRNGLVRAHPYSFAEVIPDIAHSWDISADGKTYTFHLHEGVKWHDGIPFSSADVKYNFDRIFNNGKVLGFTKEGGFRNSMWLAIFDSFEAPDPNTVIVRAQGATPLILKVLGGSMASFVPKHLSESDPVEALKDVTRKPIGTGPFRVTEVPSTTLWLYERNPDYFKLDLPYLDAIEGHMILDVQTRATAVLTERIYANDITVASFIPAPLAEGIAKQDPGIVYVDAPGFLWDLFAINSTRPPFDDLRVRQAISEALDRTQFLITGLGDQKGVIGTAFYPFGGWVMPKERREKLIGFGPDMEVRRQHARELLADYEADKGKIDWGQVPMQCATQHVSCDIAVITQQLLEDVGIEGLNLDPGELMTTWFAGVDGEFNMLSMINNVDYDDPTEVFGKNYVTGADRGFHRHWLPELDEMFEKQKFMQDFEARKKLAWDMMELVINDAGFTPIIWKTFPKLWRDYVRAPEPHPSSDAVIARMEYVWLDFKDLPFSR